MLHPAILSVYGLSDPRPHNPLASVRYLETLEAAFGFAPGLRSYFGLLDRPEHPFLDFLGVRVVVSNIYLPRVRGMRVRRLGNPILKVYLNSRPLPRFFLPGAVDLVSREEVAGWIRGMEDPRRVALLSEELAQADLGAGFRAGRVRVERSGPGDYSLRVPPQGRKLIASSIRGPEGWQARADGARLRTVTVNGAFLGVLVPPGVREFELAYLPPGLLAGVGLAGLAAVGFVGALVHERWRRRRARREGDGGGGPVADRSGNA
jgi:hypothetical protein